MTDTLTRLVERAKRGDEDALTDLLERFRPLIRSCCVGLPWHDGQDLEQELRIQLIKLVRHYDPGRHASFERYIQDRASRRSTGSKGADHG